MRIMRAKARRGGWENKDKMQSLFLISLCLMLNAKRDSSVRVSQGQVENTKG